MVHQSVINRWLRLSSTSIITDKTWDCILHIQGISLWGDNGRVTPLHLWQAVDVKWCSKTYWLCSKSKKLRSPFSFGGWDRFPEYIKYSFALISCMSPTTALTWSLPSLILVSLKHQHISTNITNTHNISANSSFTSHRKTHSLADNHSKWVRESSELVSLLCTELFISKRSSSRACSAILLRARRVKLLVTMRKVHANLFKSYLSVGLCVCLTVNNAMYLIRHTKCFVVCILSYPWVTLDVPHTSY